MSKIIFQLKQPNQVKETLILLVYRIGNTKLVYSTGETIEPRFWDKNNQIAFETIKDKEQLKAIEDKTRAIIQEINANKQLAERLKSINLQLGRYQAKVLEVVNFWKVQKIDPNIEGLRAELDKEFKVLPEPAPEPTPEKITLFGFIQNYIDTVKFTRAPQPKPISYRTKQKYNTTLKVLKDFAKSKRKGHLDFENIDLEFYQDFVEYLQKNRKCKMATNTIGKYIKTLKVFLKEATESGVNTNRAFESKKFAGINEQVEHIYLNESDLDKLWDLDLSNNKRLEAVRDLFLISCYTGLRFQDFTTINPENIVDGNKLKIHTRKTGKTVQIPIHWRVAEILAKYENHLPRAITNQKMNVYLKEVGLMAEINEPVEVVKTKGGLRVSKVFTKYNLISCHTGRRTFATNLYLAGVPAISIMRLTGHVTEAVFMRYLNISESENAELLLNHDYFKKGRLRAI